MRGREKQPRKRRSQDAIEEDQNEVLWSLLVDSYTEEARFEAEP
jgi:hypothetical protein